MWGRHGDLCWLYLLTSRTEAILAQNTRPETCRLRSKADAHLMYGNADGSDGSDDSDGSYGSDGSDGSSSIRDILYATLRAVPPCLNRSRLAALHDF